MVGLSNHQGVMSSLSVMFWLYRSGSVLSTHLQADCNRPFVIKKNFVGGHSAFKTEAPWLFQDCFSKHHGVNVHGGIGGERDF